MFFCLMINNLVKYNGLSGYGLKVIGCVLFFVLVMMENKRYIDTKRMKMGYLFEMFEGVESS